MADFNPTRLKFARKRRRLTIRGLGERVNMTAKTISDYENGRRVPLETPLSLIASELHFPIKFFFLAPILTIDPIAVSFRSLARMSASVREAALRAGEIALELTSWIDKRFETPEADLPDLRDHEPEAAAEAIRNIWGLGERPIHSMIHLLEAKGVKIFSLNENTYDMDAYSFWMDEQPFIFLNTKKSAERTRFDIAHEVGHLVLHKHGTPIGKEAESQANSFASAFLMPRASVISRVSRFTQLEGLIDIKSFWIVSVSALVRRMKDLRLLSEWEYRTLAVEISRCGYLKKEPKPALQRENSKLLPMIFQALQDDGINKNDIATELGLFVDDIDSLIFYPTLIQGGYENNLASQNKDKSHLKIIK